MLPAISRCFQNKFLRSKDSNTRVFLWISQNFYEQLFYRIPPLAASALNFTLYFQVVNSGCTTWIRELFVVYMNRYFMFIHLQFYFCNFFFTRGDFNFDWLFFIKLIWWNRTRPIFSKYDQTNLIKQKCVKFCCTHYRIYLIQWIWSN